jgi:hypothetical protein
MPEFSLQMLVPTDPLGIMAIFHYLVILGAVWMVISAGDEGGTVNTIIAGGIALMAVVDLYARSLGMPGMFIFGARIIMVMLCIVMAGMAPNPRARGFAILLTVFALPILAVLFILTQFDPYYY